MAYTFDDYLREEREQHLRDFPPIRYKFMRKAKKSHMCELCGVEIHKNEFYWSYKPLPTWNFRNKQKTYYKWRKRCVNCKPMSHEELKIIKEI